MTEKFNLNQEKEPEYTVFLIQELAQLSGKLMSSRYISVKSDEIEEYFSEKYNEKNYIVHDTGVKGSLGEVRDKIREMEQDDNKDKK